ncbi:MAG: hypothetical protein K5909_02760, partial [Bacteroidales bacterium]|nr:hypothetical protein [Bacteroidales bacterium]
QALVQIVYQTNPDKVEYTEGRVKEILDEFLKTGPSAEDLAKAKEYLAKEYKANQTENSYFASLLVDYITSGEDLDAGYLDILNGITADEAKAAIKAVIDQNNVTKIVMVGKE